MTISPLMLRVRIARELEPLCGEIKYTELARRVGLNRQDVSRALMPTLNLNRRCNPTHIGQILTAMGVPETDPRYPRMLTTAVAAGVAGPLDGRSHTTAGASQKVVANLAQGANRICEYQSHVIGGLAQTPAYALLRAAEAPISDPKATVEGIVRARELRKQQLFAEDAPEYVLLMEQLAVKRLVTMPDVMAEQLEYLVELGTLPNVSIRILPENPELDESGNPPLANGPAPESPFVLYTYPDSKTDPEIGVIDQRPGRSGPGSNILIDSVSMNLHASLFERLLAVAWSDARSATYLQEYADQLRPA